MAATDTSEEVRVSAPATPPRENLVRAIRGIELERADGAEMPTLVGHAAVFDRWTEIRSAYEGNFMERIARGAFAKTISENRDRIRVLFQHGKDPQIGDKPLGPIRALEEDDHGLRYEVELLDTSYNRDLIPGLEAGLYGASFRFSVLREQMVQRPKKSSYNPRGIPERTVEELRMPEFGPVTFGAYSEATAGLRSMTDEYLFETLASAPEEFRRMLASPNVRLTSHIYVPRFDNEDAGCLAQMIVAGTEYIDDQDETDDASDITAMQGVIKTLTELLQGELGETEPPEQDDEMYSAELEGDERATWTTAYIDNLPDSAFLHVDAGGTKDADGKTTPRSLRHFPYKDASGAVDLPHLRNALARIPQSDLPQAVKDAATAKGQQILAAAGGRNEPEPSEVTTRTEPEPSAATTRATSPTTGLYTNREERPPWLL